MRTPISCFTLASITTVIALALASCQRAPAIPAGAPAPPARRAALWNEPQFTTMLHAYRQKLAGQHRAALHFEMSASDANLQVQDPANLANVVSYRYAGGVLSGPLAVDLTGVLQDPNLDDNLFDWDQVAVERIPALVEAALTQTKLAGARVVRVKITRPAPTQDEIRRRLAEIGPRISMEVEARTRAIEQKLRRDRDAVFGGEMKGGKPKGNEPKGGNNVLPDVLAPMAVEISFSLQAPGASGWLTANASGTITGSGIERTINWQPVQSNCAPYWRRAAGLCG
jgi:hypothetical protein